VEVTLVQLYAVVTDSTGKPVRDLGREDFSLKLGSRAQEVANVSFATDVPLLLGLVVDTSGSMEHIMNETKQAAAQFLDATIQDGDQAFLVDFSTRPRLRHRATGDVMELVASFRGLRADGFTSLFDSVIFSLLEFSRGSSRRALVLLSDGDDTTSGIRWEEALEYAKRSGVVVFPVGLAVGAADIRIRGKLGDLARETGGRVFYIDRAEELASVYDEIESELRSRYLIAYAPDRSDETGAFHLIEVKVKKDGLKARTIRGYYR
jgi:VWFA-related protein